MSVGVDRSWPVVLTSSHRDDLFECEGTKHPAHLITDVLPDRKQDALPFVIARSVCVRFAEVAKNDGTVDGADDLSQRDL